MMFFDFSHDIVFLGAFEECLLLIFSYNILRYQAFRIAKMIDTLPTLATIDKRKEKCSVFFCYFFRFVRSTMSSLSNTGHHMYLVYHCIVPGR